MSLALGCRDTHRRMPRRATPQGNAVCPAQDTPTPPFTPRKHPPPPLARQAPPQEYVLRAPPSVRPAQGAAHRNVLLVAPLAAAAAVPPLAAASAATMAPPRASASEAVMAPPSCHLRRSGQGLRAGEQRQRDRAAQPRPGRPLVKRSRAVEVEGRGGEPPSTPRRARGGGRQGRGRPGEAARRGGGCAWADGPAGATAAGVWAGECICCVRVPARVGTPRSCAVRSGDEERGQAKDNRRGP